MTAIRICERMVLPKHHLGLLRGTLLLCLCLLPTVVSVHAEESYTTVPNRADSVPATALSRYDSLLIEVRRGLTTEAESYLSGLSKRDQSKVGGRLLRAAIALQHFDLEVVADQLSQIQKVRQLHPVQEQQVQHIAAMAKEADRMLAHTRLIPVAYEVIAPTAEAWHELSTATAHLGEIATDHYESADGVLRWEVTRTEEGAPALVIRHRLSDGQWDLPSSPLTIPQMDAPTDSIQYPYVSSDGETLYLSYKGEGTLGGYDLYVTRYDARAHSLLVPQQLQIPLSTMADDLAYLQDENGVAYQLTAYGTHMGELRMRILRSDLGQRADQGSTTPEELPKIAQMQHTVLEQLPDGYRDRVDALRQRHEQQSDDSTHPALLLHIGGVAIHSAEQLHSSAAQAAMRRLITLHDQIMGTETRLSQLRLQIGERHSRQSQLTKEILDLEEQLMLLSKEMNALRNEVIRQETKTAE